MSGPGGMLNRVASVLGVGGGVGQVREDPSGDPAHAELARRIARQAGQGQIAATSDLLASDGGDDAAFTALERLLEERNMVGVAAMVEAGFSPDAQDFEGSCALDYAFGVYTDAPADPVALDSMCFFALRMNPINGIELIKGFSESVDFEPAELEALGKCLVAGSKFPVVTALRVAEMFCNLAERQRSLAGVYQEVADKFSQTAADMLGEVRTDHLAALLLTEEDGAGDSALGVALSSENKLFTGDARVARILKAVWATPRCLTNRDAFGKDDSRFDRLVGLMVSSPARFLRLPLGKFVLEALSFILFLALFTAVVWSRTGLAEEVTPIECVLYLMVVAFLWNEVSALLQSGPVQYWSDGWNVLDSLIYACFIGIMWVRLSAPGRHQDVTTAARHAYEYMMSTNAVLVYIRVGYFLTLHPTVGPLLKAINKMMEPVKNFIVLASLFVVGFSLAFYFLLKDADHEEYGSLTGTLLVLYRAMLGDFSYDAFSSLEDGIRQFAQLQLSLFLFVAQVTLLNLLIALMAEKYEDVQAESLLEFQFLRASVVHSYDAQTNELPPPFNALVWLGFALVRASDMLLCKPCRRRSSSVGSDVELGGGGGAGAGLLSSDEDEDDPVTWYRSMDSAPAHAGAHAYKPPDPAEGPAASPSPSSSSGDDDKDGGSLLRVRRFYCGYCHHDNQPTTLPLMSNLIRGWVARTGASAAHRDATEAVSERQQREDVSVSVSGGAKEGARAGALRAKAARAAAAALAADAQLVAPSTVVCSSCFRVRKSVDEDGLLRERISLYVFLALLWLPVLLLLLLPFLVLRGANVAVDVVERRHREERAERIRRAIRLDTEAAAAAAADPSMMRRLRKAAARKERWTRSNFATEPRTLEDVAAQLDELHSKLKKVRVRGAAAGGGGAPPDESLL